MTWKEFKDLMESNGVEDDDLIKYIDVVRDGLPIRIGEAPVYHPEKGPVVAKYAVN